MCASFLFDPGVHDDNCALYKNRDSIPDTSPGPPNGVFYGTDSYKESIEVNCDFQPVILGRFYTSGTFYYVYVYDGGIGTTDLTGLSLSFYDESGGARLGALSLSGTTDVSGFKQSVLVLGYQDNLVVALYKQATAPTHFTSANLLDALQLNTSLPSGTSTIESLLGFKYTSGKVSTREKHGRCDQCYEPFNLDCWLPLNGWDCPSPRVNPTTPVFGQDCEIDECSSNPCQNGGTCVDLHKMYACTCPPEWTGVNCETDNRFCTFVPVILNQISVSGSFFSLQLSDGMVGGTSVVASVNFYNETGAIQATVGASCTTDVNGLCTAIKTFSHGVDNMVAALYKQDPAPMEFTLDNLLDAVQLNTILPSGTSAIESLFNFTYTNGKVIDKAVTGDVGGRYQRCDQCYEPFNLDCWIAVPTWQCPWPHVNAIKPVFGENCEIDECSSHPCQNGATCVDLHKMYACTCPPEWTSVNCETDNRFCTFVPVILNQISVSGGFFSLQLSDGMVGGTAVVASVNFYNETGAIQATVGASCTTDVNGLCTAIKPFSHGVDKMVAALYKQDPAPMEFTLDNLLDAVQLNTILPSGTSAIESLFNFTYTNGKVIDKAVTGDVGGRYQRCDQCYEPFNLDCWISVPTWQCPWPHVNPIKPVFGENCEIDECSSNPCENGGTCVDLHKMYTCTCPPEWTGVHCETDNHFCVYQPVILQRFYNSGNSLSVEVSDGAVGGTPVVASINFYDETGSIVEWVSASGVTNGDGILATVKGFLHADYDNLVVALYKQDPAPTQFTTDNLLDAFQMNTVLPSGTSAIESLFNFAYTNGKVIQGSGFTGDANDHHQRCDQCYQPFNLDCWVPIPTWHCTYPHVNPIPPVIEENCGISKFIV